VLYSLGQPKIFLVLLVGLLLAWLVHVGGQRLVQRLVPETKWYLQRRPGAAALVDPFAAVAALLGPATVGWTPPVEWAGHRGPKRRLVMLLLGGPVANLVAGLVAFAALVGWVGGAVIRPTLQVWGSDHLGDFVTLARSFDGPGAPGVFSAGFAKQVLFLLAISQLLVAVISLIPLPPLEGGRLLFLFTPKTAGWQKAEYNLAERNIGLIIVLVGLIRISSGLTPPFAYLGDVIARALALAISHL
jgi:Zn-dependent protease